MALTGHDRAPYVPPGEVRVWAARLAAPPGRLEALGRLLSADERERAQRFRFPRDRDRFVVGRGLLREILGHHLGRPPERLRFVYGPYGKPALVGPLGTMCFNVSHSDDLALYTLGWRCDLGVDVERVDPDFATMEIADRFFSPAERAGLGALEGPARVSAFFRCWTRKEAYVKARGAGLSIALDAFDVSLAPDDAALLRVAGAPDEPARWRLYDLRPAPGFAAALALRDLTRDVRMAWWPSRNDDRPRP